MSSVFTLLFYILFFWSNSINRPSGFFGGGVMPWYTGTYIYVSWDQVKQKEKQKKEVTGSYYVLYKHQRRRQLAARGHCHSSTAISAFTRRPAAEGKLPLRVYLSRPVVGHRVAQATALPSGGGAEAPFGVVAVADQVLQTEHSSGYSSI